MARTLGPRSAPVYLALRGRILAGVLPVGSRLNNHSALAAEFQVTPVTVRHALGELEAEGLISCEQGRGTFVRAPATPAVLLVEDHAQVRAVLGRFVTDAGYRVIAATGPGDGLAALEADPTITLVLSDIRMPTTADGTGFIRTVRQRWPQIPLAAVTGYPDDLAPLYGTAECPVLVLAKPVRAAQIAEVLRLALRPGAPPAPARGPAIALPLRGR